MVESVVARLYYKNFIMTQRKNESLVQFGSRLEAVLTQAVKYFHIDDAAK